MGFSRFVHPPLRWITHMPFRLSNFITADIVDSTYISDEVGVPIKEGWFSSFGTFFRCGYETRYRQMPKLPEHNDSRAEAEEKIRSAKKQINDIKFELDTNTKAVAENVDDWDRAISITPIGFSAINITLSLLSTSFAKMATGLFGITSIWTTLANNISNNVILVLLMKLFALFRDNSIELKYNAEVAFLMIENFCRANNIPHEVTNTRSSIPMQDPISHPKRVGLFHSWRAFKNMGWISEPMSLPDKNDKDGIRKLKEEYRNIANDLNGTVNHLDLGAQFSPLIVQVLSYGIQTVAQSVNNTNILLSPLPLVTVNNPLSIWSSFGAAFMQQVPAMLTVLGLTYVRNNLTALKIETETTYLILDKLLNGDDGPPTPPPANSPVVNTITPPVANQTDDEASEEETETTDVEAGLPTERIRMTG